MPLLLMFFKGYKNQILEKMQLACPIYGAISICINNSDILFLRDSVALLLV